jgi:hypothetical protein
MPLKVCSHRECPTNGKSGTKCAGGLEHQYTYIWRCNKCGQAEIVVQTNEQIL